jgi:hypothetical protein
VTPGSAAGSPNVDETVGEMRRLFEQARASDGSTSLSWQIAGVPIGMHIAGSTLGPRLTPALAHHGPSMSSPEVVVHAWDVAEVAGRLPTYPDDALDGGITAASRVAEAPDVRVRYQPDLRALTAYDRGSGTAWYCVADAAELPWWETGAPLRSLLSWVMADRGRVLVHGAAVGSVRGAVLLVGAGGSGKSSTALACLEAGMGFLGDDYCVLEPGDEPIVHTLYGTAKLHADQRDVYPIASRTVLNEQREPDDKVLLWPARQLPEQIVTSAPVRAVVAPTIVPGRASRLEPLSRATALAALAPSSILQLPGAAGDELSAMAGLVRVVPCWRLELGSDRRGVAEALRPLVDDAGRTEAARA